MANAKLIIFTTMGNQYVVEDKSLLSALNGAKRLDGWWDLRTASGRKAEKIFSQIDKLDMQAWGRGCLLTDYLDGIRQWLNEFAEGCASE